MTRYRLAMVFAALFLLAIAAPAICQDVLIDAGDLGRAGGFIRPDSGTTAVVQPFAPWMSGWANQIGVGIATATDPNHVGFKVTLTDISNAQSFLPGELPGTALGSWNVMPVNGPTLTYAYFDIDPIYLDFNKTYGLLVEPGDGQMSGSIGYCDGNVPGWATSDNWATSYCPGLTLAIRVYGTETPEPSGLLALLGGIGGLGGLIWRRKKS